MMNIKGYGSTAKNNIPIIFGQLMKKDLIQNH